MKNTILLFALAAIMVSSCSKANEFSYEKTPVPDPLTGFTKFHIPKGSQYAENNIPATVNYQELKFQVKFNESAIYKTIDPVNQFDINKLYGFSDNRAPHHEFSARIGWRWSDDSLRLFGYVYNNAVRSSEEIGAVPIGKVLNCSIKVSGAEYIFKVENKELKMPRASTQSVAIGYKLYPYFGGDELAPHDIDIWIKEVE